MLTFLNNDEIYPLEDVVSNYCLTRKSDGNNIVSFILSKESDEYKLISNETVIMDGENRYLVKKINGDKFECLLDLDFLKSSVYVNYTSGSKLLSELLSEILPEGWSVQNANVRSIRRTISFDFCTDYDIVQSCMKTYNVRLVWKTLDKTVTVIAPEMVRHSGAYLTDELNLRKITYKSESTNFVTRLYAYGKDGLTFASINEGKEYVDNNTYTNKVVCGYWIDNRYTVKQSLLEDAIKKLDELSIPVTTYECDVVDLAKKASSEYSFLDFKLHDLVTLIYRDKDIRVDHHIVQYKEYPKEPERNVVTLSAVADTIATSFQKIQNEFTDKIDETSFSLESIISSATDKITNCLEGHVYIRHNEILIMDSEDPDTASGLWRWTHGGLGYSSSGYNGPYSLALTNDGQIVADRITAGQLNGSILKAGTVSADALSQSYKQTVSDGFASVRQEFKAADGMTLSTISSADSSKYDIKGYVIELSGYGTPEEAGYKPDENNDKSYLDVNDGSIYISDGVEWNYSETRKLITDVLSSSIQQTSDSIRSTVSKATLKYDTSGCTVNFFGYGLSEDMKKTDTGVDATDYNGRTFLNQSDGKLYESNGTVWVLKKTLPTITENVCSFINQSADTIELSAGRLIYNGGKCTISSDGTLTAESGVFRNCSIIGGSFVVVTESRDTSIINLGYSDDFCSIHTVISAYGTVWELTFDDSDEDFARTRVDYGGISISSNSSNGSYTSLLISDYSISFGSSTFANATYITNDCVCTSKYLLSSTSGVLIQIAPFQSYGSTLNIGLSEMPLRLCGSTVITTADIDFTSAGKGIQLQGNWAFRLYNNEVSVGISNKILRFYGSNVVLSNGEAVTSDERKKNSIELLDDRYLTLIRLLQPKKFKYNDSHDDRYHAGFIAQDLKEAIEKSSLSYSDVAALVDIKNDGSEFAIRYSELISILLYYVKFIESKLDKLESLMYERSF